MNEKKNGKAAFFCAAKIMMYCIKDGKAVNCLNCLEKPCRALDLAFTHTPNPCDCEYCREIRKAKQQGNLLDNGRRSRLIKGRGCSCSPDMKCEQCRSRLSCELSLTRVKLNEVEESA